MAAGTTFSPRTLLQKVAVTDPVNFCQRLVNLVAAIS